jgi:hypothetical protein
MYLFGIRSVFVSGDFRFHTRFLGFDFVSSSGKMGRNENGKAMFPSVFIPFRKQKLCRSCRAVVPKSARGEETREPYNCKRKINELCVRHCQKRTLA